MSAARLTQEREAEIRARLADFITGPAVDWSLRAVDRKNGDVRHAQWLVSDGALAIQALLRELDLMRADGTAALDAAARGASDEDALEGYATDLENDLTVMRAELENAVRERDLLAETVRRLHAQRDAALERVTEYGGALVHLEREALRGGTWISRGVDGSILLTTDSGSAELCVIAHRLLECVELNRRHRALTEGSDAE